MSVSRSIKKREKKNRAGEFTGYVWRARYRDDSGKEHMRNFDRKKDGDKWLDEATAQLVTGTHIDPAGGKTTFEEYAEHYRSIQVHRPSTADRVQNALEKHTYPTFGHREMGSITPSEIQAWVKKMSLTMAPSTVAVIHGIVSSVFKTAVRDRKIHRNPCDGTKLPEVPPSKVTPPQTADVVALHKAIPDEYKALIHLIAATGLRSGEAFGLTVDRVDFLRGVVTVDRQALYPPKKPIQFGPPKRPASYRDIPAPKALIEELSIHIATYGTGENGLIFADGAGGFVRRTHFSTYVWLPTVTAAGLKKGTRLHDIRHYYASLLISNGESVKVVQKRLGHASAAETLDTYAHLWPDSDERTRDIANLALVLPETSSETPAGHSRATADQ